MASSGASYYDVDAILAEEERIQVLFNVGCTGLGRVLDPSCDDDDLAQGADVDLPFWMVPALMDRNMVNLRIPKFFGDRVQKDLQADPAAVDLRTRSPYFYSLGLRLRSLTGSTELGEFLFTTFQGRYSEMLTKAFAPSDDENRLIHPLLTNEEREIYEAGMRSWDAFSAWKYKRVNTLQCSQVVARKRRRTQAGPGPMAGA